MVILFPVPPPPFLSREELSRQMWSELERLLRAHAESTSNHQKLLDCLLELKQPPGGDTATASPVKSAGVVDGADRGSEVVKEEKPSPAMLEASLNEFDK